MKKIPRAKVGKNILPKISMGGIKSTYNRGFKDIKKVIKKK